MPIESHFGTVPIYSWYKPPFRVRSGINETVPSGAQKGGMEVLGFRCGHWGLFFAARD